MAEGPWRAPLAKARPGDVAIIQFGPNDQKPPDLLAAGVGYRNRLECCVATGSIRSPVPDGPVVRTSWLSSRI